jgi:hypothetical protein
MNDLNILPDGKVKEKLAALLLNIIVKEPKIDFNDFWYIALPNDD